MTSAQPTPTNANGLPQANARVIPPAAVSVLLGVIIVYAGHIVEDTPVTEPVVIGGAFLILGLSVMHYISPGLTDTFALLLLIVMTLRYGVPVLTGIGLAGNSGTA